MNTRTLPFVLDETHLREKAQSQVGAFGNAAPYPHVVIDDFLPKAHVEFLAQHFPEPDHAVWLDWRKRAPNQFGKQGPGNSAKFSLLDPSFLLALQEFNSWKFLMFLENVTGITNLIPDPYFEGGGFHQILNGGILDIHADFNAHPRLGLFRILNVLIYLTQDWQPSYEGCLELWDGGAKGGKCVKSIAPVLNRAVVFLTNKKTFHGHPKPWNAPEPITRRSISIYYYTANKVEGQEYDAITDFQGISVKSLLA